MVHLQQRCAPACCAHPVGFADSEASKAMLFGAHKLKVDGKLSVGLFASYVAYAEAL